MMRPFDVRRREFEVLAKLNHENIVKIYASETEVRSFTSRLYSLLVRQKTCMLWQESNTIVYNSRVMRVLFNMSLLLFVAYTRTKHLCKILRSKVKGLGRSMFLQIQIIHVKDTEVVLIILVLPEGKNVIYFALNS